MKVGDYVRINENVRKICIGIGKITNIVQSTIYVDMNNNLPISFERSEINKSRPNIKDLIEVGDYVNGEKVCYLKGQIDEKEVAHEEDILYTEYNDEYGDWYGYAEDEIETIVTHEQFSQMEYKVGE